MVHLIWLETYGSGAVTGTIQRFIAVESHVTRTLKTETSVSRNYVYSEADRGLACFLLIFAAPIATSIRQIKHTLASVLDV